MRFKRTMRDRIQDEVMRTRYLKQAKKLRKEIEPVLNQLGYGPKQGWGVELDGGVRLYVQLYLERANPVIQIEAFLSRNDRTHKLLDHNQIGVERPVEEWRRLFLRRIDAMRNAVADHFENMKCPHCDDVMVMRKVKQEGELHGEIFWGCIRFPECRGMDAPWKQTTASDDGKWIEDVHCPDCGHPIAVRYAKHGEYKGKRFYGCTAYPACKRVVEKGEFVALKMLGKDGQKQPEDDPKATWDGPLNF